MPSSLVSRMRTSRLTSVRTAGATADADRLPPPSSYGGRRRAGRRAGSLYHGDYGIVDVEPHRVLGLGRAGGLLVLRRGQVGDHGPRGLAGEVEGDRPVRRRRDALLV